MAKISVQRYLDGVEEIYQEQPDYKTGGDGSGGVCDCIGMSRGAVERAGITTSHYRGTNDAARTRIENLHKFSNASELRLGQVVLKVRDKDDPNMPLPDRYRPGGSAYNGDLTNYTHIGTVTHINPLEITHMTSPKPMKDTKIGKWCYVGDVPWVDYTGGGSVDPDPGGGGDEPVSEETATTYAEKGSTVNLRSKDSTDSALVDRIPIGESVIVKSHGDKWCKVTWKGKKGYVMTQFLIFGEYVPGDSDIPDESPFYPDDETVLVRKADLIEIMEKISSLIGAVG